MADVFKGLTDLIILNDKNANDSGCSDILNDAPFLASLSAVVASNGTHHKYLKETGVPTVGFRLPYQGRFNSTSTDSMVDINLSILDASDAVDTAIADAYRSGPEALVAREVKRKLKQAMFVLEKQILNGDVVQDGGDPDGFPGFADAYNSLSNAHVVNGGSTTANVNSSIYLVRTGDECDVNAVIGQEGEIDIGDTLPQRILDANGKPYWAYCTKVQGWAGLQLGTANSVVRIANINATDHKATDALIYAALALFPASKQPNKIVMNRRSLGQIQASRTATNIAGTPAPRPTEVDGIDLVVTDGIGNTEALVA